MVSFNVYRSTYSGAYVEGICLATDEKPVVGIANGSILFAVDISTGETTRYMYDQESMSWIEAECPCSGGGSGGGGGASVFTVNFTYDFESGGGSADKTYAEIMAAVDSGAIVRACLDGRYFYYAGPGQIPAIDAGTPETAATFFSAFHLGVGPITIMTARIGDSSVAVSSATVTSS